MISFFIGCGVALAAVWVVARFVGFRRQKPQDYSEGPPFDLRMCLNGKLMSEGVIFGPLGGVTSRFVAQMHGRWDDNNGILRERFRYESGMVQDRRWHLKLGDDGRIFPQADDIATSGHGRQCGNACQLKYRITLPQEVGGYQLDVVDWMYLLDNGTIMNRSQFRKFGFKVLELVAVIRPATPDEIVTWESMDE